MKKKYQILIIPFLFILAVVWMATDGKRFVKLGQSLEIFGETYRIVNNQYSDPVDPNLLMRTAIDSMLASIDPYTNYFSEYQMEKVRINFKGFWDGVGFSIMEHKGKIIISEIFEESAASASKVSVGDELLAIDGAVIKGKAIEDIEQSLHGKEGTQVIVTLKKSNEKESFDLNLTRSKIERKNVPFFDMLNDSTAYIVLTTFSERASANVANALIELQKKNKVKQVILDLRDNGGGLLIEAVNLCNVFLEKDIEIVSTKNKVQDWDRGFKTMNQPVDTKIPLIILVNERSASASEIVAGAVQDLDRGILLGRRTFGKGLVQNTYDIGYNSKVKLTTAKYYIPSGRCIQALEYKDGKGVKITDSLEQTFYTKKGRKVNDGGGLLPDRVIISNEPSPVLKSLIESKIIFDYVNIFESQNDSIASPENFKLTNQDFTNFENYISTVNYKTDSEKQLDSIIEKSKEEGLYELLKSDFEKISLEIQKEKKLDFEKNRSLVKEALEEEIVSRYYFEKGKIQLRLKRDIDVNEALKLFSDKNAYESLLKP